MADNKAFLESIARSFGYPLWCEETKCVLTQFLNLQL